MLVIGLLIAAAWLPATADHIPGHDACDPTFPLLVPGPADFNGGGFILFVTLIGPAEDTVITNTTFDITYVSDGTMPASALEIQVKVQLDSGEAIVSVLGSELGFGSGPGTFVGTFQTSGLNGVVAPGFPGPVVNLQISRLDGSGVTGNAYFDNSTITFDVVPPPPCETAGAVSTVPDGGEGGTTPLLVERNGNDLGISWDVATASCASTGYHLLWGWGANVDSYSVAGSDCTLDDSGTHLWSTSPDTSTDWAWFLVVGDDGAGTESGWGFDGAGADRALAASGSCGSSSLSPSICLP